MWERNRARIPQLIENFLADGWGVLEIAVVFLFVLIDSVHFLVSCVLLKGHLWLSTWEISMIITFTVQSAFFSCNHYLLILFTPLFTPLFHEVHAIDTCLKFVTIKAFYQLLSALFHVKHTIVHDISLSTFERRLSLFSKPVGSLWVFRKSRLTINWAANP